MSEKLDPEMIALEQSLGHLKPACDLDRDQVMYRAGKAASGLRWPWPLSTAVSTVAAAVLGFLLWKQSTTLPESTPAPRVIVVERLVAPPPPETPSAPDALPNALILDGSTLEYLRKRQEVLSWGVDALHSMPGNAAPTSAPLTPVDSPRVPHAPFSWPNLMNFIPSRSGGDS